MQAVDSKFNWARHHFQLLYAELTGYLQVNPCKFVPKPNVSTDENGRSWVMGTFEAVISIPERLPLIVGDCQEAAVHRRLPGRATSYCLWESPRKGNAFPIVSYVRRVQGETRQRETSAVDPHTIAVFNELQPYHLGIDAERSRLAVLNKFTNINKHRRLLLTCLKTVAPMPDLHFIGTQLRFVKSAGDEGSRIWAVRVLWGSGEGEG